LAFALTLLLPLLDERERCFFLFPIIESSNSELVLFSTWGSLPVVVHFTKMVNTRFEVITLTGLTWGADGLVT
jgi:hypothetical protein